MWSDFQNARRWRAMRNGHGNTAYVSPHSTLVSTQGMCISEHFRFCLTCSWSKGIHRSFHFSPFIASLSAGGSLLKLFPLSSDASQIISSGLLLHQATTEWKLLKKTDKCLHTLWQLRRDAVFDIYYTELYWYVICYYVGVSLADQGSQHML